MSPLWSGNFAGLTHSCAALRVAYSYSSVTMPSKYHTLLKGDESLRGRGFITVLANQCSGGDEDEDEAPHVIRSNCVGTLVETISRLENPHCDHTATR